MRRTQADQKLCDLIEAAENKRRCLTVVDPAVYAALHRRVQLGDLVRPFPNMVMRAELWNSMESMPRVRWRYVQDTYKAAHPTDVLCSFSAALEYGLWVSANRLHRIHIAVPTSSHVHRSRSIHRHRCSADQIEKHHGTLVTGLMQTVLDCSLEASFPEGLAIADSAVRFCGLDPDRYRAFVDKHARLRTGAEKARLVARHLDGRSENGGESIARGMIIELGYMPPTEIQAEFADPVEHGATIRVDQYYVLPDGTGVIGEVDGMGKYGDDAQATKRELVKERQRESHLTALKMPVMRILFKRIYEPGYLENLLETYGIPKR